MAVHSTSVDERSRARELLDTEGRTYAEELGIDLRADSPQPLFRLLCFALLCSTRISTALAVRAAEALTDAGWTTADALLGATWEERVDVLDAAGYARYDFRTATRLEEMARLVRDRYGGDVRRLRDAAHRDVAQECALLQEVNGIGPAGADVFLREAQAVWPELQPYVGRRAAQAAAALGLPTAPDRLARLVSKEEFPRLVAALVRTTFRRHKEDTT